MGQYLLKLPKMGESVAEATVTKWLMEVGDKVVLDDAVLEIATDKVDTDVTSEVTGVLFEKRVQENEVVSVGAVLAVIEIEGETTIEQKEEVKAVPAPAKEKPTNKPILEDQILTAEVASEKIIQDLEKVQSGDAIKLKESANFYSPLVRNIAQQEGVSVSELDSIKGTGVEQRVTKNDILAYIKSRGKGASLSNNAASVESKTLQPNNPQVHFNGNDQIVEMSRMEKLISTHMKSSIQTAAHVQSFIEVDVTNLWKWREEAKNAFQKRENEKLTFTPLFMTAIIKALRDYPQLNSSVQGDKIIMKQAINLGMAAALPDGNLIVPVVKNADHFNLIGLAKAVNDLAARARNNALKPDEVQEGTYTFTNIGNFGSLMGTPIINQPQVGILAIGAIRKVPAVIETKEGDFIGIRHKVILSHSYDHRIINGATGGLFVKRVAEYLENWEETLPY
ncbi:2-oxo acid dehydrogenase subunit E2 [Flavobacteriaceae bacterium]|jgi:2-oxoglutarate dehydrogenase E2 component (dihydrolipoamide succinyltransferase)|nr:2-oxo acid dehydrogenase subunit E2 [Flavobacteriaceae bacterium]MBT4313731.1 2-oxo acid dehydrogenase subunit E2 [Flavobacteriaceae bacterium]MBT5091799.1 2-oxo acid dehydrogenase subunit E2 [Flavobacteriaceae bacterium]MBT5283329.1 2-oxo acid dehydrogenase subunit E2 [Flavobacteriaceae bacterium]MBT5446669.1 2-oxo acid dehydrogenase subunit E2 [Flavobacteriaceae bacterium]|tara:strand:- start:31927 stop:33279 length:1353 start_codon:yes stop_codon:yes gene_type:complete